jgi:hypothetical protein
VTTFQQIILVAGLCFMGYMLWPAISAKLAAFSAWLRSGKTPGAIVPADGISVEQAQAATLLLTRFRAQTPPAKELKLIDAEIKTLAEPPA